MDRLEGRSRSSGTRQPVHWFEASPRFGRHRWCRCPLRSTGHDHLCDSTRTPGRNHFGLTRDQGAGRVVLESLNLTESGSGTMARWRRAARTGGPVRGCGVPTRGCSGRARRLAPAERTEPGCARPARMTFAPALRGTVSECTPMTEFTSSFKRTQRVSDITGLHRGAQLPGDDVAGEVVQDRREIEPAPADHPEPGEVGLRYAQRYLAVFEYRFNRRFDLPDIIPRLVYVALRTPPMPERLLKLRLA